VKFSPYKLSAGESSSIAGFWTMVGPYIASRNVIKELGNNIYDNGNTIWFVIHLEKGKTEKYSKGQVAGFGAIEKRPQDFLFRSMYVIGEYRKQGIYTKLFKAMHRYIKEQKKSVLIEIVTNQDFHKKFLEKNGFSVHRRRGSYYVMQKQI
jgi:GNAT superfamily N-acetyltransferase